MSHSLSLATHSFTPHRLTHNAATRLLGYSLTHPSLTLETHTHPHRPVRPCQRRRGDNSPLHSPWVAVPSETTLLAAPPRPSSLRRMSVHRSHDKLAQAHCATSPLRRPAVSRSPVAVNCSLFAALTRPATSKSASL
ncbi:hypothetical protein PIB30_088162 [Stylosanthes scabra]|uniref:Uncharacterized protein n=1 Tax=Stylosanthes scabra TaxID=79078 RepID=A0ABU6TU78_9FABA|nr:hypothetical protein [Stylosanthes scabra]